MSCTQYKSKCAPAVGTRPPYVACTACLNRGRLCEPRPLEPKKSKKEMSSPAPPPKSGAAAAPLRLEDEDKLALLLPGDPFPNGLPSLPIHGASGAPLGDLIIWHAEYERATREHNAACLERDAAVLRVFQADSRRRLSWNNFAKLSRKLGTRSDRDKGKRRESPVSVHDDSDVYVAGFADSRAGTGDSGAEEDEEEEYDEEDEGEGDDDEDGELGEAGVMDVSDN